MKKISTLVLFSVAVSFVNAQAPITSITTVPATAATGTTYDISSKTYNWGVSPNNSVDYVEEFKSGGNDYAYTSSLPGQVKIRRVDNSNIAGTFTLVWARTVNTASVYNLFPEYDNNMETFFNTNVTTKGTDNLFTNGSTTNVNNIERLDWVLNSVFSTPVPEKIGFAIFERGNTGGHDPFCIAAITAVDGSGNPTAYGNIVRVASADYGDVTGTFNFNVLKAPYPQNLVYNTNITQLIGGVFLSLQSLGIGANQSVYGYSLFSDDLPLSATPADLVDYTNSTFFPTNTTSGGLDLAAVTGIFVEKGILPVRFTSFTATEKQHKVDLKWSVENEASANYYVIERSEDGSNYSSVTTVKANKNASGVNTYSYNDDISGLSGNKFYYRIKQYDLDGSSYLTQTLLVRVSNTVNGLTIYPNPVKSNLFITMNSSKDQRVKISILNFMGQEVANKTERLSVGNNSIVVDAVSSLAAGSYHLVITDEAGVKEIRQFIRK